MKVFLNVGAKMKVERLIHWIFCRMKSGFVMKNRIILLFLSLLFVAAAQADNRFGVKLARSAEKQIGVTTSYDPAYRRIAYPGGDVAKETGVCTDVVIRAYRDQGTDLQKEIHEDMQKHFAVYPKIWGMKTTDTNIDHRRVQNIQTFLKRHGKTLSNGSDFQPGDIVTWNLKDKGVQPHIGIVANDRNSKGVPLVIHNINSGVKKEDVLYTYTITGHYRYNKSPALR
ncbi:DUF1287 domain-containing protein [Oxalobacter sp. OttesenSCG-928-P03]|nr:DUF1287 domain-containing protein [Oxalobacter sp. OttesenSCG-928-P03]